mmetsp:Transcript_1211/g.2981  ORF Transcript_1211/g.2981 Transcript_1211/m.2981 type:complete len:156 (-) Transcript_1211:2192-2659(-)
MEPKSAWSALTSNVTIATFIENLRPWNTFFSPSEFNSPKEPGRRVQENCRHFASNYAVVVIVFMILGVLSQPSFFLSLIILATCWFFLLSVKGLSLFGEELTNTRKNFIMICISASVTLFVAGTTVFCVLGITSVSIALHALFHEQPKEEYEYQV